MKKLILLNWLLLISAFGFSQLPTRFDGDFTPCSVDTSNPGDFLGEYENSVQVHANPGSSSTCDIFDIFFEMYRENNTSYLVLGVNHGNGGQALYRFYFNTDCDSDTGQLMALENDNDPASPQHDVGGADYRVDISANGNGGTVSKWNGTGWDIISTPNFGAATGTMACAQTGGTFMEMWIPLSDVFDPCNYNTECGVVELTTAMANSGNSTSSSFCGTISAKLELPANQEPSATFQFQPTCDYGAQPIEIDGELYYLPTGFRLNGTTLSDPNLGNGSENLSFAWNMFYGDDLANLTQGTSTHGSFSNPTGTGITTADASLVNTNYIVSDWSSIIGTLTPPLYVVFELAVTDSYGCSSEDSDYRTATIVNKFNIDALNQNLCDPTLPITLTSFAGDYINEKQIELSWSTVSETNNDKFVIERKGIFDHEFEAIGEIAGAGDSQDPLEYKFIDSPFATQNYYRIKQVDFDGAFEYSDVIKIEKELDESQLTVITGDNEFVVNFALKEPKSVQSIQVTNMQGKILDYFLPDNLASGNTKFFQFYIPNGSYGSTLYFITIEFGDGTRKTLKAMKI